MRYPLLLAAVTLGVSPALAQNPESPRPIGQISLLAGPSPYDLGGVGTAFAMNLGFAWRPLHRVLVVEPGLGYLRYTTGLDARSTWLFPELSVQAEAHIGSLRPYLGGGVGQSRWSEGGHSAWDDTIHGVVGARISVFGSWGVRAEMRVRGIRPGSGSTTDLGFGFTRRIL
jgi:hypothetical protein